MSMKNKVAIVAGGGRDIGAACAIELGKAVASVMLTYHSSADGANAVVSQIQQLGGKAHAMQADLTDAGGAEAVVATTLEIFGQIDSLVHVSGGLIARKKS